MKTVALTALGEKTKAELLRRFYAPPDDLVALPRQALEALRDALGALEDDHRHVSWFWAHVKSARLGAWVSRD